MIVLHRLGHNAEQFHLNPDLMLTVEATPDTVVTLTTGTKIVVAESPQRVAEEVRAWRAAILAEALGSRREAARAGSPMAHAVSSREGERPALSAIDGERGTATENSPPAADHPER